jgi:hypothetical protein
MELLGTAMNEDQQQKQSEARFEEALKHAMCEGLPPTMPPELRARIAAALAAEAKAGDDPAHTGGIFDTTTEQSRLRVLPGGERLRRSLAWIGWPAAVAAALVVGMVMGSVWSGRTSAEGPRAADNSGDGPKPSKSSMEVIVPPVAGGTPKVPLDVVSAKAAALMLTLGTEAHGELEGYAKQISFKHAIPEKVTPEGGVCSSLTPVAIAAGDVSGVHYDAVVFCSGIVKIGDENKIPGAGKLVRVVMFMLDGDVLPKPCRVDATGSWLAHYAGFTYVARYLKSRDMTLLISVPGEADEARARALAEPLLTMESGGTVGTKG